MKRRILSFLFRANNHHHLIKPTRCNYDGSYLNTLSTLTSTPSSLFEKKNNNNSKFTENQANSEKNTKNNSHSTSITNDNTIVASTTFGNSNVLLFLMFTGLGGISLYNHYQQQHSWDWNVMNNSNNNAIQCESQKPKSSIANNNFDDDDDEKKIELEPVTQKSIPKQLILPDPKAQEISQSSSNSNQFNNKVTELQPLLFKLISVGVRQVTLFYISVYTIGLYASESTLNSFKATTTGTTTNPDSAAEPEHNVFHHLKKANTNNNIGDVSEQGKGGIFWDAEAYLKGSNPEVNQNLSDFIRHDQTEWALRIEPTRPTNGAHLRKGFLKLLETRYRKEKQNLTEEEDRNIVQGLATLRASFPLGAFSLGTWFLFVKRKNGIMEVYQNDNLIFSIASHWMSSRFFECYLDHGKPPSDSLRKDFAKRYYENFYL